MITANAFVALESLLWHNEIIKITKETELTEKEDRSVIKLNFLCDSQIIWVFWRHCWAKTVSVIYSHLYRH